VSAEGIDALLPIGSRSPEREPLLPEGGKGAVVVGPEAARCAGAKIRRLALIIQLDTWLIERPVA